MFNLAISNSLIAIVGMFRGLGIIDPSFIGFVGGQENGWCSAYLLFMMLVRSGQQIFIHVNNCNTLSVIIITVDIAFTLETFA